MSTDVGITVVGGGADLSGWAHRRVDHLEQMWSRFRDDSEISRLNAANGEPLHVSVETVHAVHAACAAWAFTGGRFDPTVHDSLLRLGYDDTIEMVRRRGSVDAGVAPVPAPGCNGIVFDEAASVVQLPLGVRLDLGGIGKGLVADDVACGLIERGARGAMVNVGGDVRVIGTPSSSSAWRIEVEDPRIEQICVAVGVLDGGVATSTTLRRRWRLGSSTVHHLIDPRQGVNARHDAAAPVSVTVVAGTAAWADALSKVPFAADGSLAGAFGVASAFIVRDDGSTEAHGPVTFEPVTSEQLVS